MNNSISDAVTAHSQNVGAFDRRYQTASDFIDRRTLWSGLIQKYSSNDGCVLDVGCGTGVMSFIAADHNESVLGIDGSEEMLVFCRQEGARRKVENISFQQSMVEDLPMHSIPPVELILCSSVLEYVGDLNFGMKLLAGLLKPGGAMIVSLPNKAAWYRMFERCTFKIMGRPTYLSYVRNIVTLAECNRIAGDLGLECLESHYYGIRWPMLRTMARKVSPIRFGNLFACVYRKPGVAVSKTPVA